MTYTVETKNLRHQFSNQDILLNDVNLQVPQGSIFGFLGRNGSGKTTTLKLVLGLLKIQKGEVFIFGEEFGKNRIHLLKQIGTLIESPSFYAHLSARDNLVILQKIYQFPKERINEILNLVGLFDAKKKKVSQFSLGMKQRLSIAIALLHQPKLLILDEPTNGLDPNGIIEIRTLLKKINLEQGTTILISSHLLTEMEKLVDHLAILNNGRLVYQGSFNALKQKQEESSMINFVTDDITKTNKIISELGYFPTKKIDMVTIKSISPKEVAMLIKTLVTKNIDVYRVEQESKNLEYMYTNLIN